MDRAVSLADWFGMDDAIEDELLGILHGFGERLAVGQVGGNGTRERAARAMSAGAFDALALEVMEGCAVIEDIRSILDEMSPLDKDRRRAHGGDFLRCRFHGGEILDFHACQHFRFGQVRRHDIGQGQEDRLERFFCLGL